MENIVVGIDVGTTKIAVFIGQRDEEGKISIKTPIAQGLLNKKVGDVADIKIPRGMIRLRIDGITIE